jgi:hypothetical protein
MGPKILQFLAKSKKRYQVAFPDQSAHIDFDFKKKNSGILNERHFKYTRLDPEKRPGTF